MIPAMERMRSNTHRTIVTNMFIALVKQ